MIDWRVARATGARLGGGGPEVSPQEAADAVAELRAAAARAEGPVREFAQLHAESATAPVLVVDRSGWIDANLETFATMLDPVLKKAMDRKAGPLARRIGGTVGGAEIGAAMGFMSARVLGQFDPFWDGPAGEGGRLLLVAPNIVDVERKLEVDPHDFRLWVCLHEETHRVQFTAVPWMRDHLRSLMEEFLDATEVDSGTLSAAAGELVKIVRGDSDVTIADLFQNETQKRVVAQMTGIMSLLEGHADVVMDGVGPEVIPSVATIRRKFNQKRKGAGPIDKIVRRLMGLEGKMRQYRDGAAFVRAVVDEVGIEGFNAVWAEPAHLPSRDEILAPRTWLDRVAP
jgi:coenzyme F420 biosynthesis associated uncharacterized protein